MIDKFIDALKLSKTKKNFRCFVFKHEKVYNETKTYIGIQNLKIGEVKW